MPLILLCFAGLFLDELSIELTDLNMVSITRVDFPPPETPVTQVKVPKGKEVVMFFKFPEASTTSSNNPIPFLLFLGISIFYSPDKYFPVIDIFDLLISS